MTPIPQQSLLSSSTRARVHYHSLPEQEQEEQPSNVNNHKHYETAISVGELSNDETSYNGSNKSHGRRGRWCCDFSQFSPNRDAVHFGIRMSVTLTLAFIFALVPSYQHGIWVSITVLFVSWFPNLDAASVIEKSMQRLIGTFFGATLGLFCGFFSMLFPSGRPQDVVIAFCFGAGTFAVCFSICQFQIGGVKIISNYNYASVLCLLTFIISLQPFRDDRQWRSALYRIMNVALGCVMSAAGAVLVLPRSTTEILQERVERQIKLAGESSEAVLHAAADVFYGGLEPMGFADDLLDSTRSISRVLKRSAKSFHSVNYDVVNLNGDAALEKCENAIQDWKVTKSFFKLLHFDPLHIATPSELKQKFHEEAAETLARALRIQTTAVLIDGIVRNDPQHDFDERDLQLLTETGTLIRQMLTVPFDEDDGEKQRKAAEALLDKLGEMRRNVVKLSGVVSNEAPVANGERDTEGTYGGDFTQHICFPRSKSYKAKELKERLRRMDTGGTRGRGAPKFVRGSNVCALLFLQLVDHLILRSLRLYVAWTQCDDDHTICRHPSLLQLASALNS